MFLANKISAFNRNRKWNIFLQKINPLRSDKILDVGFTDVEYSSNDNYLEKNYPHQNNITALGVDDFVNFEKKYPQVRVLKYDGNKFPLSDNEFEICWSNATIEHVGGREKQVMFLKEIVRVSNKAFITTPNRNFPIEVHTRLPLAHLLPKKIFDKILNMLGIKWATGDYMNLLTLRDVKGLLRDAGITNYEIIKNKLLFFTLDFVIIFNKNK